jgi:hypothetical protein
MDKIRPVIQWFTRNRFWVTCVLVSVISVATWYMAWTAIDKQREDRASKLKQKNSSIENVITYEVPAGVGEEMLRLHPNKATVKGMQERIDTSAEAAVAAWRERYNKQRDLLQFPDVLPPHIRDPLANHEPMEKPLEQELLDETQRDTFREEIPKYMPTLAAKIQTSWVYDARGNRLNDAEVEGNRNRDGKSRTGSTSITSDLVVWDEKNQELWNSKTTEFAGFNGNTDTAQNRPTSQQMLALCQDLWILGGIFDVIAEVNEGFTANDLAPIERVDHVLVGADADNNDLGSLTEYSYQPPSTKLPTAQKKKGGLRDSRQMRREANAQRSSKAAKRSASFDESASSSPFHGRYVDRDYSQLNEKEITNVITADKLSEQSYLAVAKRVPVRIAVKMDERRVNDFLAAAANSPFAFEIRQVRINKHEPGEGVERKADSGGGAAKDERGQLGLGGGAGGGGSGRVDGPSGGGRRGGGGDDDGPFRAEARTNFDIKIEFIGIVKIYNPVDRSLFFPEEKQGDAVASNN